MTTYNRYYVSGLEDKEKSRLFLAMLFAYSDAFSLLYYRRKENEKYSQNVQKIKEQLEQFRIGAEIVKEWPLTKQLDDNDPVCFFITYKTEIEAFSILEQIGCLWDFDYPTSPTDISFFKDGYCWFESCAHERINNLYLEKDREDSLISNLRDIGVKMILKGQVSENKLFVNKKAIIRHGYEENSDTHDIVMKISDYHPGEELRLAWNAGYRIESSINNDGVLITANTAGLKSLANHLLNLAQYDVPSGAQIELDKNGYLEQESVKITIRKE